MPTPYARKIASSARPILGWRSMRLVRVTTATRDPQNLTGGTNNIETSNRCRGRVVSVDNTTKEPAVGATRTAQTTIALLGASLPDSVQPLARDKIVIASGPNSGTYLLEANALNDDGLGAVWTCVTRKVA